MTLLGPNVSQYLSSLIHTWSLTLCVGMKYMYEFKFIFKQSLFKFNLIVNVFDIYPICGIFYTQPAQRDNQFNISWYVLTWYVINTIYTRSLYGYVSLTFCNISMLEVDVELWKVQDVMLMLASSATIMVCHLHINFMHLCYD